MKTILKLTLAPIVLALVLPIAGCKEKSATEKAADQFNKAASDTGDAVKNAAEKVGDSAEKAYSTTKEAVKDGAKKVEEKAKEVTK